MLRVSFSLALALTASLAHAAGAKPHVVVLGAVRKVPYSVIGDPAGARKDESDLRVRPLLVDGKVKEWTTGDAHDITDRSFVVRRAIRLNDALPTDAGGHTGAARWVWQRGPWLLIDRISGKVTALRLPDYDPAVSDVVWFRDYAAYCGLSSSGRQLYAVVAQIAARRPVLSKKLHEWNPIDHPSPACSPAVWQREPLRIGFQSAGSPPVSFDLVGLSAVLVEDGDSGDAGDASN
ncbi:MAG TPA: hypothetical protein VK670_14650 [Silvibacterium sp.]|nr:hypothetical protein [Silvibacterium sp.]